MFSESFRVVTADRPSMIQAESTRRMTSITAIRAHKKASLHHERRRREGTGGDGRGRGMGRDLFREEPLLTCRLKRVMSYCFISESRSHPSTCCLFFPCWCMAPYRAPIFLLVHVLGWSYGDGCPSLYQEINAYTFYTSPIALNP